MDSSESVLIGVLFVNLKMPLSPSTTTKTRCRPLGSKVATTRPLDLGTLLLQSVLNKLLPFRLHPQSLTWNLKILISKRNLLFQGMIFRFHLKLQGCKFVSTLCPFFETHLLGNDETPLWWSKQTVEGICQQNVISVLIFVSLKSRVSAGTVFFEGFRKKNVFPSSSQPEKWEDFDFHQRLGIGVSIQNNMIFYSNTLSDIVGYCMIYMKAVHSIQLSKP